MPSVLSTNSIQNPTSLKELFEGIERVCIGGVKQTNRHIRCIHSWNHGHYSLGRHLITLPVTSDIPFFVLWFGFYPWNEKFHKRKLQIKDKIPQSDYDKGTSSQHCETQEGNEIRRLKSLEFSVHVKDVHMLSESINYSIDNSIL